MNTYVRSWVRSMLWAVVVATAAASRASAAESAGLSADALRAIRRLAIQHNGRIKPFDSFSREALEQVTGAPAVNGQDPVATVLSMMAEPERWQAQPLVSVPFRPLRAALGMDPRAPRISYSDLVATRRLMRMLPAIVQKQQRDEKLTMLEQETMDAFDRFIAVSGVFEQGLHLVPPPASTERAWLPILTPEGYPTDQQQRLHDAWNGVLSAVRASTGPEAAAASRRLAEVLAACNPSAQPAPWRLDLEVFYNHAQPFRVARICYLLAFILLAAGLSSTRPRPATMGELALWAAFAVHAAGITLRVVLGGRPPVSNFYETMLWLPFVAVVVALICGRIYRVVYFGLAASLLAGITLVLADHVPLDSSITPVVAVLRSNLWLTVHVLTIVASYGALALATVLAHVYSAFYLTRRAATSMGPLDTFLYRVLQVGVVLLAGGIMLGAVWANASWGRYWGWDPKETWALITLLWYLAVLHGRFAGWLQGIGVALATIGGFFLLLMTYYGVSFYLVGLHSYAGGHAKPLPALLIAYLIAEVAFLAAVGLAALARRKVA